ncbi:hypothetical protein DFH06DRAFT_1475325 [Mycena polygramma]|nr:hypothetical protein DFH06DRAFT_1475325 [Mycena polygramma]
MKITELVVGPGGFKLQINDEAPNYWLQTDYERIEERCWGGLSPDSPVPGLCTDLVDTCFVFVFRCVASGRTTLCHAVSETDPAAFDAQMRYAAGDDARGQVEIVVFKGRTYGEPDPGSDPEQDAVVHYFRPSPTVALRSDSHRKILWGSDPPDTTEWSE